MEKFVIIALLIISVICSTYAAPSSDDLMFKSQKSFPKTMSFIKELKEEFEKFKKLFGTIYKDAKEEAKRFELFIENYLKIKVHNAKYNNGEVTFRLGVNKFADLSMEEMARYRGFGKSKSKGSLKLDHKKVVGSTYIPPASNQSLPRTVDWRKRGAVTPVKDQGQCGSCWSFSTTGSVEGQHFRKAGRLVSLSEQQLVDCAGEFMEQGCNGGLMIEAFQYIETIGGLDSEKTYPYVSGETQHANDQCSYKRNSVAATVSGFVQLRSGHEDELKGAIANVGPISVAIDASSHAFMFYESGVYTNPNCSSVNLDHGVLAVGYGVENSIPYWLVKNSWANRWGDEGYIKMRRDYNNMCGIATTASYPLV